MMRLILNFFKRTATMPESNIPVPAREDAPVIFARLFQSDDGQRVIAYLKAQISSRAAGPEASEAMLRYCDGQRGLLQTIQGLVEQGR